MNEQFEFSHIIMKNMKTSGFLALAATLGMAMITLAADKPEAAAIKPYPLTTCVVSGDKLGGDMGAPYVFTNGTQEIKFCCKNCLKDFNKDQAKYLKMIDAAEKAAAKK